MDDIAKAAGLAKGTVYLYFGTKEALFLELVAEAMAGWLAEVGRQVGPKRTARAIAATLAERPALIRLLALLHPVLERNTDASSLRVFKHRLLELTREAAALLEKNLHLKPGAGTRVVLWMHALVVGLGQMASPSPTLAKLLAEDEALSVFRLDFRAELESALTALFTGASRRRA